MPDSMPKDGDGDGKFTPPGGEDNMPYSEALMIGKRRAKLTAEKLAFLPPSKSRKERLKEIFIQARTSGFTVDKEVASDIVTGISVGRNRHGIDFKVSEAFDENGMPRKEAIRIVLAWLDYHGEAVFSKPQNDAREVGIGGWVEKGVFYLDVVDVYDNTPRNLARAGELGKAENQISVAHLDQIQIAQKTDLKDDWAKAYIDAGGNGSETLDKRIFEELAGLYSTIEPPQITTTFDPDEKSLIQMLLSSNNPRILIRDNYSTKHKGDINE